MPNIKNINTKEESPSTNENLSETKIKKLIEEILFYSMGCLYVVPTSELFLIFSIVIS